MLPLLPTLSSFFSLRIRCAQTAHGCGEEQEDIREKPVQTRQGDTASQSIDHTATIISLFFTPLCHQCLTHCLFLLTAGWRGRQTIRCQARQASQLRQELSWYQHYRQIETIVSLSLSLFFLVLFCSAVRYLLCSPPQYHITGRDCFSDVIFVNIFFCT